VARVRSASPGADRRVSPHPCHRTAGSSRRCRLPREHQLGLLHHRGQLAVGSIDQPPKIATVGRLRCSARLTWWRRGVLGSLGR
jgi:hypothetical protein